MSKVPKIKFCPFCGADEIRIAKLVPRCKKCLAVFFVSFSRYTRSIGKQLSMETTKEDIGHVLTNLAKAFEDELIALPESELEQHWYFKWDETASIEWNTYKFSDMLEMYKRSCRRWEEQHNGNCCVVERVRDKYLMSKVRDFLAELAGHNASLDGRGTSKQERSAERPPRPSRSDCKLNN